MDITVSDEPMQALASKMMKAAEAGDLDAVRDCYTDDATLWVNTTGKTLSIDEHLANMRVMRGRVSHLRYLDIRVNPFVGGFVQQHRVLGDLPNGAILDIAACFVVKVRDGKIAHRDEYIDSAAQAPVRG
jgi:ketosteroid isomerase-like protein